MCGLTTRSDSPSIRRFASTVHRFSTVIKVAESRMCGKEQNPAEDCQSWQYYLRQFIEPDQAGRSRLHYFLQYSNRIWMFREVCSRSRASAKAAINTPMPNLELFKLLIYYSLSLVITVQQNENLLLTSCIVDCGCKLMFNFRTRNYPGMTSKLRISSK